MNLETETWTNLTGFYHAIAGYAGLTTGKCRGIEFVMNRSGDWPSYILGGQNISSEDLSELSERMRAGKLPSFWLRKTGLRDDFDSMATELGIRQVTSWTGMEMERNNPAGRVPPDDNCLVERISGEQELREWLKVVNQEVMSGKQIHYQLFKKALGTPEFEFFRIIRQKKTLATLLGYSKDGIAGLYMISTKSGFRGRGYGTWVTSESIDYYIRKGIRKFVLHSTTAGYPLYRKLGFRENSRFGIYWLVGKF